MTRRASHVSIPVTYGSVGATQDPNIVRFPPEGFTGFFDETLIGRGKSQFAQASDALLSWGAQRNAGIEIVAITPPNDRPYRGVVFNSAREPVSSGASEMDAYTESGEPFMSAGTSATMTWASRRADRRVRVIYTDEQPKVVAFAIGTLDTEGVIGEVRFSVEHRDDGSVWATTRGFLAAPEAGWLGVKQLALVRLSVESVKRQIRSLAMTSNSEDE